MRRCCVAPSPFFLFIFSYRLTSPPTEVLQHIQTDVTQIFAGASAGSDRKGEGPATFPSFRSVMTTTSEITDANGTETTLRVAKTQVGGVPCRVKAVDATMILR